MLVGTFGRIKIAEQNLNLIRQSKDYTKSVVLEKKYGRSGILGQIRIKYNQPVLDNINFDISDHKVSYDQFLNEPNYVDVKDIERKIYLNNDKFEIRKTYMGQLGMEVSDIFVKKVSSVIEDGSYAPFGQKVESEIQGESILGLELINRLGFDQKSEDQKDIDLLICLVAEKDSSLPIEHIKFVADTTKSMDPDYIIKMCKEYFGGN